MVKIISDKCMDSADWVESVSGYRPKKKNITLKELSELSEKLSIDTLANHWDYPLTELLDISREYDKEDIEDKERGEDISIIEMALVRFSDGNRGYEYRFCEI